MLLSMKAVFISDYIFSDRIFPRESSQPPDTYKCDNAFGCAYVRVNCIAGASYLYFYAESYDYFIHLVLLLHINRAICPHEYHNTPKIQYCNSRK